MAAGSFGMTGMPGANFGGGQVSVPTPASSNTPAIGGATNPTLPTPPTGQAVPGATSTIAAAPTGGLAGTDVASLLGMGGTANSPAVNEHDWLKAMKKGGFSSADAAMLWNFLQSGAGFNPQVAQALIAAMQPGVQRKEADINEMFGGMGGRGGTSNAVAMGDFLSQEQLNEDQVWANLYENSVKNFMTVLLAGKSEPKSSFFDNLMKGFSTEAQLITAANSGGKD